MSSSLIARTIFLLLKFIEVYIPFRQSMKCPRCGSTDSKVTDTRASSDNSCIKRRRQCLNCGYRFVTNETLCAEYPIVIKRDGKKENFSRDKIRTGLMHAVKNGTNTNDYIDKLLHKILNIIISSCEEEVTSKFIGDVVMQVLKEENQVAYLRFASVYKHFESADDFLSEYDDLYTKEPDK